MNNVQQALSKIHDFDNRDTWLRVGMALHSTHEVGARELWDTWSEQSDKFDLADQDTAWRSFARPHRKPVTLGTLFYLARRPQ